MEHTFKCAFYGMLFSAPIWAILIWFLMKYRALGIVIISLMMLLFFIMTIAPYVKDYYGEKENV